MEPALSCLGEKRGLPIGVCAVLLLLPWPQGPTHNQSGFHHFLYERASSKGPPRPLQHPQHFKIKVTEVGKARPTSDGPAPHRQTRGAPALSPRLLTSRPRGGRWEAAPHLLPPGRTCEAAEAARRGRAQPVSAALQRPARPWCTRSGPLSAVVWLSARRLILCVSRFLRMILKVT